jgi:hypothetical protein
MWYEVNKYSAAVVEDKLCMCESPTVPQCCQLKTSYHSLWQATLCHKQKCLRTSALNDPQIKQIGT